MSAPLHGQIWERILLLLVFIEQQQHGSLQVTIEAFCCILLPVLPLLFFSLGLFFFCFIWCSGIFIENLFFFALVEF